MEIEKTVLYLIKSNGKRNKPNDKQKTISKNELKNRIKKQKEKPKKKNTKRYFRAKAIFWLYNKKFTGKQWSFQ